MWKRLITSGDIIADIEKALEKGKKARLDHKMEAQKLDAEIVRLSAESLMHKDEASYLENVVKAFAATVKKV